MHKSVRVGWLLALLATLALVMLAPDEIANDGQVDDTHVAASAPASSVSALPPPGPGVVVERNGWPQLPPLLPRSHDEPEQPPWPLFGTPARPTPALPEVSSPVVAPAPVIAPYSMLGWLRDGPRQIVFFQGPGGALAVQVGTQLDGQWRLERLGEDGAVLRHLPSGREQTVNVENKNG